MLTILNATNTKQHDHSPYVLDPVAVERSPEIKADIKHCCSTQYMFIAMSLELHAHEPRKPWSKYCVSKRTVLNFGNSSDMVILLKLYNSFQPWKNFENWLRFSKVITKIWHDRFLTHGVLGMCSNCIASHDHGMTVRLTNRWERPGWKSLAFHSDSNRC